MADLSSVHMSVRIYILDTSYLLELFACGRDSNKSAVAAVRERFKVTNKSGGRFFVPLPCLFELGDHIADVRHDKLRAELCASLKASVRRSLEEGKPWMITPTGKPEDILIPLLDLFEGLATKDKVGLVDCFTLEEANRLKMKFQPTHKAFVHIWTNDRALKEREPDPEPDPFLW